MKFVRLLQGGGIAFAFLRQDVENHRLVLGLEKLKGADEQRDIMPVNRAVIAQPEILEDHARRKQVLNAGFDLMGEVSRLLSRKPLDELPRFVVQVCERRVGDDAVEILSDGADILGDRPLVVVQHEDQAASWWRRDC